MKYNDYYDVDIKFLSQSLNLPAQALNFSIHDSIHRFYSNSNILIQDNTGLFRESLVNINGCEFEVLFGDTENTLKSKYTIKSSESDEPKTFGILNGDLNLLCENSFYYKQNEKNEAFNDRCSNIVKKTIKENVFKSENIKETDSKIILYRMSMNQKDFIEKVVLPNSFSSNCNNTPFYCFIDVENNFNFISWSEMFSSVPKANLYYSNTNKNDFDKNKILSIKPFSKNMDDYFKKIDQDVFYRNYNTGEFFSLNSNIRDFPKNEKKSLLPIIKSQFKSINVKSFDYEDYSLRESVKAKFIFENRVAMGLEFFEITIPFNSKLMSGKTVNIEVKTLNETSKYNSDKFLIEDCIHSWDGKNKRGTTTMIISRKQISIPNNYKIKTMVLEG